MFLRSVFLIILFIFGYFFLPEMVFAQDTPKILEKLSDQFDHACQNLREGKTENAQDALEDTLRLLTEQREKSKGRARKMMGNSIREIKRLKKDILHNNLQSRLKRLELQYANAELALKFHLKRTDSDFRMGDERILGRNGLCIQNES